MTAAAIVGARGVARVTRLGILFVLTLCAALRIGHALPVVEGLVEVPMTPDAWEVKPAARESQPTPRVTFERGIMTIDGDVPIRALSYPQVSVWAKRLPPLRLQQGYHLLVEARVDAPGSEGNFVVGINEDPADPAQGKWFFQHWHLNRWQPERYVFYGDWSEVSVLSQCHVDTEWHTFELEYNGFDTMTYRLDGQEVGVQPRRIEHPQSVLTGGQQARFHVYFERYPPPRGPVARYAMHVRRFAVKIFPETHASQNF